MSARVFISYNQADREMAEGVAHSLARSGVDAWLYHLELLPGVDWVEQLRTRLQSSDAVVAIVPEASEDSSYMGFELGAAKALNKPIVVVTHGNPDRLPYSGLADTAKLDAAELSMDEIANTIQKQISGHVS